MKRIIALALATALSVGVMLPLATDWSEAAKTKNAKKRKKVKKYSRQWWKNYRAKLRRQRSTNARKRTLAAKRERTNKVRVVQVVQNTTKNVDTPVAGWVGDSVSANGETQYKVADTNGKSIGSAQLALVGAAIPGDNNQVETTNLRQRDKTLGGVAVSSLRRTVIDKMIREQGWIVNDYQREVDGKKVFVVVAQTPGGAAVNSRLFYFTEVGGRIYSLSTSVPNEHSDKIAADSETFLKKLHQSSSSEDVTAASSFR